MCRNIRALFNFELPATDDEIRAASLQFIRKISGLTQPSKANETAFELTVNDIAAVVGDLLDSLVTSAPTKDREAQAAKARTRATQRFGAVYSRSSA